MAINAVIHIIDDDDAVRQSLAFLLTSAGLTVRSYPSGTDFLGALATLQPGCIISDVRMPDLDGLQLQRRLKELDIRLPMIIMTGHGDVPLAVEAMRNGAVDFIEKPFDDDRLLAAIEIALDLQGQNGHRKIEVASIQEKIRSLSPREDEVLQGLLAGLPNKIIAYNLTLSARTVEVHRANVMTKMGATNLSELIRMALIADARWSS